jgi:UDP-N-acetylmuramate--alanine ligase
MYKCLIRQEGGIVLSKFHSNSGKSKVFEILKNKGAKIHFTGVGGVGMYSLFKLSDYLGYSVSGSDREGSSLLDELTASGYDIKIGHRRENAINKDLVVYTLAVDEKNPEIAKAVDKGILAVSRAEYLGVIMENYKERIGVSGSHGKSTTTAMLDAIFSEAKKNPTTLLGARLNAGSPIRIGSSDYLIYEACEYKDSFLYFSPTASVFTNLELDHVDYFKDLDAIKASFLKAMNMPRLSVINKDDENLRSIISDVNTRIVTFGECESADYQGCISERGNGCYSLKIRHGGREIINVNLSVPGRFNAKNALASASLSYELGINAEHIESALSDFSGIERRLEKIGELNGVPVYYDYAHHPTEIECAIGAVKDICRGEVAVIFKPHTYSRTAGLMNEFVKALSLAERVYLTEISAIREKQIEGVSSEAIARRIGEKAKFINDGDVLIALENVKASAIIIMGAANLDVVKSKIIGK